MFIEKPFNTQPSFTIKAGKLSNLRFDDDNSSEYSDLMANTNKKVQWRFNDESFTTTSWIVKPLEILNPAEKFSFGVSYKA